MLGSILGFPENGWKLADLLVEGRKELENRNFNYHNSLHLGCLDWRFASAY